MEILAILRVLRRRRLAVAAGVLVAVCVGAYAMHESGSGARSRTWAAATRVFLDTGRSQLVNVSPSGATTLPMRAALVADLASGGASTRLLAHDAGVPAADLAVLGPAASALPEVPSLLETKAAPLATEAPQRYDVSLYADELTPVIWVEAYAPSASEARRLAGAAIQVLSSSLPARTGSTPRPFVITTVSPPRLSVVIQSSKSRIMSLIAPFIVLLLWCVGVVLVPARARPARRAPVAT